MMIFTKEFWEAHPDKNYNEMEFNSRSRYYSLCKQLIFSNLHNT